MKLKRIINKTKKGQRERKVKELRKDLNDNDIKEIKNKRRKSRIKIRRRRNN